MDAIAGLGFGMPLTFLTVVAQFAVSGVYPILKNEGEDCHPIHYTEKWK